MIKQTRGLSTWIWIIIIIIIGIIVYLLVFSDVLSSIIPGTNSIPEPPALPE